MANLTDADKVLRNDVGKSIVSKLDDIADAIVQQGGGAHSLGQLSDVDIDTTTLAAGQSIVYNETTQKFENGQVSTVGGLNDLDDVTLTNVTNKQELVYDDSEDVFKNKTTRVELTQAEYDALANPLPDVDYYITDAPSMQGTSADLSYDGGTDSVYDVVEDVKSDVSGNATAITALQTDKANKTPTAFSVTAGTGITIQYQRCCAFGELKFISLYFSASSSATSQVGTVPSDYKAKGSTFFPLCKESGTSLYAYIATNSASLQRDGAIPAGTYMINGFYW